MAILFHMDQAAVAGFGTVDHGFLDGIQDSPPNKNPPEYFFFSGECHIFTL
jgi:hypothetical protein